MVFLHELILKIILLFWNTTVQKFNKRLRIGAKWWVDHWKDCVDNLAKGSEE